jgi:hypothetical protein
MDNVIRCESELGEEGYIEGDFSVLDRFHGLKLTDPWKKNIYDSHSKIVGFYILPQPDEPGWVGYKGDKRWIAFAEYYGEKDTSEDKPINKPIDEPIAEPITGRIIPLDETELPLTLPEMKDYKPSGDGKPPLSKATDWVNVKYMGETDIVNNKPTVAVHYKNYNKLKAEGKLDLNKNYWVFSGGGLD